MVLLASVENHLQKSTALKASTDDKLTCCYKVHTVSTSRQEFDFCPASNSGGQAMFHASRLSSCKISCTRGRGDACRMDHLKGRRQTALRAWAVPAPKAAWQTRGGDEYFVTHR